MTTPAILALDLGTSGAKAALIDVRTGRPTASAFRPYPTRNLPGGGVEQDPADWLHAARAAITGCLGDGVRPAALSLTGQMQDLICLDASGRPLGPAVLYSDTRASRQATEIAQVVPDWEEITGNEHNATSNAAMFRRLAQLNDPRAEAATLLFSPAGYLIHRLGLGTVVDETTAGTTGLFDIRIRGFSGQVAAAAGIDAAVLPQVRSGHVGDTGDGAFELLGLPAGVPVVLAPGDATATTAGIVGVAPGDDYLYLGSSGWHAEVREEITMGGPGAVHQLALPDGGILRIAAVLSAGATAQWARSTFLGGAPPEDADRMLVERGIRGFHGLLSLPSIHGERFPVRDDALGAAVTGMRAGTRPIDIYAAVLEGVALGLSHSLPEDGDRPLPVVGGGTNSRPWMEIVADVTGREVRVISGVDAALNGCALAATDALGLTDTGVAPLVQGNAAGEAVPPDPAAHASWCQVRARHRALYAALGAGRR